MNEATVLQHFSCFSEELLLKKYKSAARTHLFINKIKCILIVQNEWHTNFKVSGSAVCWFCLHTGLLQQYVCVLCVYILYTADQAWQADVESMPCTCTAEQSDMIGWKQPHKPDLNTNGCDPRQVQEVTIYVAQCSRRRLCVCVLRFEVWPAYVVSSFPRPADVT